MKRRKKRSQPPSLRSDPTPERLHHANGGWDEGDDRRGTVVITMRDAPLERMRASGAIDPDQYNVGCIFRNHWHLGGMDSLPSADLERLYASRFNWDHLPKTLAQAQHRSEVYAAMRHIGPVNARVLGQVICFEMPLHRAGILLGWNTPNQARAAATERVRDGLDRLVELWT